MTHPFLTGSAANATELTSSSSDATVVDVPVEVDADADPYPTDKGKKAMQLSLPVPVLRPFPESDMEDQSPLVHKSSSSRVDVHRALCAAKEDENGVLRAQLLALKDERDRLQAKVGSLEAQLTLTAEDVGQGEGMREGAGTGTGS